MPYIYITRTHADDAFARRLTLDLQRAGFEPWVDVQKVSAGASYLRNVNEAISEASALIVVVSRSALQSMRVATDWQTFHGEIISGAQDKVIITILRDMPIEEWPLNLAPFLCVDFRGDYQEALAQLVMFLSQTVEPRPSQPPVENKSKGYVFLSYVEEDATFVGRLRVFMGKMGYSYWDYQESDRDYHTQLVLELEDVIRKAAATLCILSPEWKSSLWALKEYFFCLEAKVPVFLLKIREIGPTLAIAGEHYIDFVHDETQGFERLRRELVRKNL